MNDHCHLYFHAPCFDGAASAAMMWDFLAARFGEVEPELHPVGYDVRTTWLATPLPQHAAVVDFLFHPDAAVWVDHHATSFLSPHVRRLFKTAPRGRFYFDALAPSCARVIWDLVFRRDAARRERFAGLAMWADKIDAARYESVEEAVLGRAPAQVIGAALARDPDRSLCCTVVRTLRRHDVATAAALPEVADAAGRVFASQADGNELMRRAVHLDPDGLALFDVDASAASISRYSPFLFHPKALYSVGVMRWKSGAKLTAMRNPWIEFESAPIGELCVDLGGGGHRRVGSVAFNAKSAGRAAPAMATLAERIRAYERSRTAGDARCSTGSTTSTSTAT